MATVEAERSGERGGAVKLNVLLYPRRDSGDDGVDDVVELGQLAGLVEVTEPPEGP